MEAVSLVLTPIIKNLISTAASFAADEVGLVLGVEEEAKRLQSNLKSIEAVLLDAEERQAKDRCVRDWLAKLQDAAYKAEDILETFATEAALWKKHKRACDCMYKRKAAHKIKEISKRLNDISDKKQKFHLDEKCENESLDETPWMHDTDTSDVCGREKDKVKLREWLLSDDEGETSIIPIFGMAGLGKTTLARLLYDDSQVKEHFQAKSWVTVSDSVKLDRTRILREMLKIDLSETNLTESQLKSRLLPVLFEKRFLLVLDDVWTEDYMLWKPFLDLVKQGHRGSKVLVTTRSTTIAKIMGKQYTYPLGYLPEAECWSLFKKIAFSDESERSCLEKIGRQIVGKCKGLPLAVKAMASLLRGDGDVENWQRILGNEIWELEDRSTAYNTPNILPSLKISYDRLPSYHKQCFAYCSIFPKAHVFEKEELVKIWISQGFIPPKKKETVEETGNTFFKQLLSRCFFQPSIVLIGQEGLPIDNGEEEVTKHIEPDGRLEEIELVRYQMHDLFHDLAQSISNSHCCQVKSDELKISNSRITTQEHRHVSLLCEDVEQPVLSIAENSKNLRTLLFPSDCLRSFDKVLKTIFKELKYLRMLDLSNSTLEKLPSSIEELKLLRYLDFSKTEIKQLPNSICNLYNLQTLKLLGCPWLFELPKDFGNLVHLRYLELDEMFWFKCSQLPPSIGNLTFLHNLHAFHVGRKRGYGIEELMKMVYLTGTLHISKLENAVSAEKAKLSEKKNLDKLVLEWSKKDVNPQSASDEEKILKDLQPHSNVTELCILNYMGNSIPDWMAGGLLQNLHTMTLNGCTACRTLSLAQMPGLRVLNIKGMPKLEKWSDESCMSLRRLKISCCEKLSEVPERFPELRSMKIKKCCSLKSLPLIPSLDCLILVDNAVPEYVREVIVQCDNPILEDVGQEPEDVIQPEERPNIQEMRGMIAIIPVPEDAGREMEDNIQPDEGPNIEEMRGMIAIIPVLGEGGQEMEDNIQLHEGPDIQGMRRIISFPRWSNLPGLKALYITRCNDLVSLSGEGSLKSLSSLELLSIQQCSNLKELTHEGLPTALKCIIIVSCSSLKSLGTKGTLKSLNSLADLQIEDCCLLESFPDDGLPLSLQHLVIQDCPSLTQNCRTEGPEWPKIRDIPDREIGFNRNSRLPEEKTPLAAWCLPFWCLPFCSG